MRNISMTFERGVDTFLSLGMFFPFEQMLFSFGKVSLHKVSSKTLGLLLLIYALIVFCINKAMASSFQLMCH